MISYREMKEYLHNNRDSGVNRISTKFENAPEVKLLFELIADCREILPKYHAEPDFKIPDSLTIQEMINRLLAHPLKRDAQIFLQGLGESAVFFKKIMQCLRNVVREVEPEDVEPFAEKQGVVLRDAQALLNLIPTLQDSNEQNELTDISVTPKENIIGQLLSPKYFYRYATAAAVLVAAIAMYVNFFVQPAYLGVWDDSQPYDFKQFGLVQEADLKTTSRMRSSVQNPMDIYKSLAAVLGSSLGSYQKLDYQNAANELAQNQGLLALFQKMMESNSANGVVKDPAFIEKANRLIQEYRFSLGLMYLACSTSKNDDLNTAKRNEFQKKSIEQLAEARSMAEKFALNTDARELYFMGVANRVLGKEKEALSIFQKIPPESLFFTKARQEIEKISN